VNYASNARWIAWNEEALRRLLNRNDLLTSDSATFPTFSKNIMSPTSTTPSKPDSWYPRENNMGGVVTPSIFETAQNMFNNEPIYDHYDVYRAMDMDDNILDIQ
jgi:hypothetical protein